MNKEEVKHLSQSYYELHQKYYALQQENKRLNGAIQTYDILLKSNVEENKQLKEKLDKYENPEDMTLFAMWCTEKVKEENQKLKDNWNKLKEIAKSQSGLKKKCHNGGVWFEVDELLDKMQELEQGSEN